MSKEVTPSELYVLGNNVSATVDGKPVTGKVVEINGNSCKIKIKLKGPLHRRRGLLRTRPNYVYKWIGPDAKKQAIKSAAKSKKAILGVLSVLGTLAFFHPQAKVVIEVLKKVVEMVPF